MLQDFLDARAALDSGLAAAYPESYAGTYATTPMTLDMTIRVVGDPAPIRHYVATHWDPASYGLVPTPNIMFDSATYSLKALRAVCARVDPEVMEAWRNRGLHIAAVGINIKRNAASIMVVRPEPNLLREFMSSLNTDEGAILIRKVDEPPREMSANCGGLCRSAVVWPWQYHARVVSFSCPRFVGFIPSILVMVM